MIKHLCNQCYRVVDENENKMEQAIPPEVESVVNQYPDFHTFSSFRKLLLLERKITGFKDWPPALRARVYAKYGIESSICKACTNRVGLNQTITMDTDNPTDFMRSLKNVTLVENPQKESSFSENVPTIRIKRTTFVLFIVSLVIIALGVFLAHHGMTGEGLSGSKGTDDLSPMWTMLIGFAVCAGAIALGYYSFKLLAFSGWVRIYPDRIEARDGVTANGPYKVFPRNSLTHVTMEESSSSGGGKGNRRPSTRYYRIVMSCDSVGKVVLGRDLKHETAKLLCIYLNACCDTTK